MFFVVVLIAVSWVLVVGRSTSKVVWCDLFLVFMLSDLLLLIKWVSEGRIPSCIVVIVVCDVLMD